MFVFKHAFLNLRKHIWNYLLVGIMLLLLILGAMLTDTIYTSAKLFTENYSKKFMTLVTILEPDLSNLSHEKKLTKEQYVKFGESKYVNGMKMIGNAPISFETLKTIAPPTSVQFQKFEDTKIENNYYQSIANWFSGESADLIKELTENGMKISSGSTDLKHNECLVSSEFAQLNQLKIGDSIQVVLTGNEKKEKKTLVIAGMYQPNEQDQSTVTTQLMSARGNDIFTNWETLHAMKEFDHFGYNSVSYELKSMDTFDKFLKEMKTNGLPNEYQVMTNEANMQLFLSPVNGMETLAGTILLGFFIFGNFGLALFSIRTFRQRQTEIYVLRNIGITKKQIINSRAIELMIVAFFSFSLSFVAAKWFVQPIADWLLGSQKRLTGNVDQLFNIVASDKNESITSIPMVLNADSFITIVGITILFLITIISIDSYKVFKFEPIEFLLERNLDE
nr:ABC transporter permease [Enterococcus sp. DIV0212c]